MAKKCRAQRFLSLERNGTQSGDLIRSLFFRMFGYLGDNPYSPFPMYYQFKDDTASEKYLDIQAVPCNESYVRVQKDKHDNFDNQLIWF